MKWFAVVLCAAMFLLHLNARAADAPAPAADPELEAKVQRVAQELRCLVCQNQTIADSNAELAQDLRREVRRLLAAGSSEDEVRRFMVERYGDFVLYRPPFQATTFALWLGPFLLLAAALWIAQRIIRARRRAAPAAQALTAEEQARLRALLAQQEPSAK